MPFRSLSLHFHLESFFIIVCVVIQVSLLLLCWFHYNLRCWSNLFTYLFTYCLFVCLHPFICLFVYLSTNHFLTDISLETEVEDLKESKTALENIVTKFEQECSDKDMEIRELRERVKSGLITNLLSMVRSLSHRLWTDNHMKQISKQITPTTKLIN